MDGEIKVLNLYIISIKHFDLHDMGKYEHPSTKGCRWCDGNDEPKTVSL